MDSNKWVRDLGNFAPDTANTAMNPYLGCFCGPQPTAVSENGTVVLGTLIIPDNKPLAFEWTPSGGERLIQISSEFESPAFISSDGAVAASALTDGTGSYLVATSKIFAALSSEH
jgi:hypothetical protein